MCLICDGTKDLRGIRGFNGIITCQILTEIRNITFDTLELIECQNLREISNINGRYFRAIDCPELLSVRDILFFGFAHYYFRNNAKLTTLSMSDNSTDTGCIKVQEGCRSLASFPFGANIPYICVAGTKWVDCCFEQPLHSLCGYHEHTSDCFPHYNKIILIQYAMRKKIRRLRTQRTTIQNLDILVADVRDVVVSYI
jgi:hypothetical protein